MSLLRDIQASLLADDSNIGPILLRLRFLASRLGSDVLVEWIKHEMEGYPPEVEVPNYRVIDVRFTGDFGGAAGDSIRNAPIPPFLIEKHAGKAWTHHEMRQSVATVDEMVGKDAGGSLGIGAEDLILVLQGKIYPNYTCMNITGNVSRASLIEVQYLVKTKILEFTIELEKLIPVASEIVIAPLLKGEPVVDAEKVTQLTQQIFNGNVTNISSSGSEAQIILQIGQGNREDLEKCLVDAGIEQEDAVEFAKIVAEEEPESADEPLGKNAKKWLLSSLKKGADGTWKIGVSVASSVLSEAAKKYYGL